MIRLSVGGLIILAGLALAAVLAFRSPAPAQAPVCECKCDDTRRADMETQLKACWRYVDSLPCFLPQEDGGSRLRDNCGGRP